MLDFCCVSIGDLTRDCLLFLKDRKVSSFGCFVFDFACFVFEFWVLRFRVLGASFSSFGCFVFEIWVLRASVFVFECFVFETTHPYHSVKRSRMETGSFRSSDVFSSSGIIQAPVFHSPITSTTAASLPTRSESTFLSKSQCFLRYSPCLFSLFVRCGFISSYSEYYVDYKM